MVVLKDFLSCFGQIVLTMNIILTDNHDITIVKSVRSGCSSCKVPKLPLRGVILLGYSHRGSEFKSNFWLLENILTIGRIWATVFRVHSAYSVHPVSANTQHSLKLFISMTTLSWVEFDATNICRKQQFGCHLWFHTPSLTHTHTYLRGFFFFTTNKEEK